MYLYFSEDGTLKEIITEQPFRVGDSQRDKIYVYWDGEHSVTTGLVKYRLPDGTNTIETAFYISGDESIGSLVGKELPQEPKRNLEYFSYDHTYVEDGVTKVGYLFYEITIPDEVLESSLDENDKIPTENNLVCARVRFIYADSTYKTLGAIVFSVETNIGIITDNSINQTQYNYLMSKVFNFGITKQNVLTFDTTPTQNSTNPVTSGGLWTKFRDCITAIHEHNINIKGKDINENDFDIYIQYMSATNAIQITSWDNIPSGLSLAWGYVGDEVVYKVNKTSVIMNLFKVGGSYTTTANVYVTSITDTVYTYRTY